MTTEAKGVDVLVAIKAIGVSHMAGHRLGDFESMQGTVRAKALAELDRYYSLGHHHCRLTAIAEPSNWLDRELVKQSRKAISEPMESIGRFDLHNESYMQEIDAALARLQGGKGGDL